MTKKNIAEANRNISRWIASQEGEREIREALNSALKKTIEAEKERRISFETARKIFGS